jgi:lysine-ketoglutarate reductase/saccharopine dehydrogenase-like protein (TIGR00300 family)
MQNLSEIGHDVSIIVARGMAVTTRILMCPPTHFDVDYVINPWMAGNLHKPSLELAHQQWQCFYDILNEQVAIDCITPQLGWPDMVFTANAGLVLCNTAIVSRFYHKERQGEEAFFKQWFVERDYQVHELPPDVPFEGAGDALLDREGRWLWAGYGMRSELDSHLMIAKWLDIEVLSLRLIDGRFYHLDTCFCPLSGGYLLYYPEAFDTYSNRLIEQRVPAEQRIAITEPDALNFACNAVNLDELIVLNYASDPLVERLTDFGFQVIQTPLTEFIKAGGSAKCLTLRVTEPFCAEVHAKAEIESCVVEMEGHLLDSRLLDNALDCIVNLGGSFQVLQFRLGERRQSTSWAELKVIAPSSMLLDTILARLIDLGAHPQRPQTPDVKWAEVELAGVAPEDFYVSTIYPIEVQVKGQWVLVQHQRMDAAIALSESATGTVAQCKLLRNLEVGDRIVVGIHGIRTIRKPEVHEPRAQTEFSFMGAGVSSERRVELVVEQLAWELRRIREQRGKTVVVAGPVVVHTGGGVHLAHLIRAGFVQALLGGNAIAVHDIEQALLGTSLGIDLQRGVPVQGGHHHHLKAINLIRRCGSIANAVQQGGLTQGILYECVQQGVPFALAGSIRDDGPLPDTEMDLIKAQAEYARLIEGADLILMLSSMLHSIGVGNMTPAGVKLFCVDINPAVVTKLSDRGSLEAIGVVTDVGLFLSLLIGQIVTQAG